MAARSRRGRGAARTTRPRRTISCPRGTRLTLDLTGRAGIADDGDLTARGAFGNLPCGEAFVAPLDGEGTLVASSLAPLGLSGEPAKLTVAGGRIVARQAASAPSSSSGCGRTASSERTWRSSGSGPTSAAQLTGQVLEDEKILGTVHVAFGASAGIGGTVSVPIHLDVVVLDASLEIGGTAVLDRGRYVLTQPDVTPGEDPRARRCSRSRTSPRAATPARSRRSRSFRRQRAGCSTSTPTPTTTAACSRSPARRARSRQPCVAGARETIAPSRHRAARGHPPARRRARRRADRVPRRSRSRGRLRRGARARRPARRRARAPGVPVRDARQGRTRAELRRGGPQIARGADRTAAS